MHDAYFPTTFHRYNRPLRSLLIDDQPWFVADDFVHLMGHHKPQRICQLMEDDQIREVLLAQSHAYEKTRVISESGIYKAFYRYQHPENRHLRRWLTHEVIPTLRDMVTTTDWKPRRAVLNWEGKRVSLLDWQGELWVPLDRLPSFSPVVSDSERWWKVIRR